ncbi:MAG: hypothetical protein Q9166_004029 [cf. Caloplaca sp. 2 TL-2023]
MIVESLNNLSTSYKHFVESTKNNAAEQNKRLGILKKKYADLSKEVEDNFANFSHRVQEVESAVRQIQKQNSNPRPYAGYSTLNIPVVDTKFQELKTLVQSQQQYIESLIGQQSNDHEDTQSRLTAIEEQLSTLYMVTPAAPPNTAQSGEPSKSSLSPTQARELV